MLKKLYNTTPQTARNQFSTVNLLPSSPDGGDVRLFSETDNQP